MRKGKNFFKSLILSFTVLGLFVAGAFVGLSPSSVVAYADYENYDNISNNLEDFVDIETSEDIGKVGNTIYLYQTGSSKNFQIADEEYRYTPDSNNPEKYYYFNFQNSLSLFYNLTNEQIKAGMSGTNLLTSQSITNYVSQSSSHDDVVAKIGYTPSALDIKFTLNTNIEAPISFGTEELNNIILTHEGCYTLVVPLTYSYTENDGLTFVTTNTSVYYTFMVFNADTYFNSTTGLPNLIASSNIQESTTTSTTFSRYYFYNYSYGFNGDENNLPSISYDPSIYEIKVVFTDYNGEIYHSNIKFDVNKQIFTQIDENNNEIENNDYFVQTTYKDGKANLYFYNIGTYDLSFTYLYKSIIGDNEYTYALPLDRLENNTIFKNKSQRFFVFGYQAQFSDYSQIDEATNQPKAVELKSYDFKNGKYNLSADITSEYHNYKFSPDGTPPSKIQTQSYNYNSEDIKNDVLSFINTENIIPVSTNQTPIKFITNANNVSSQSMIYKLEQNNDGYSVESSEAFKGFNQNNAGTYLYVIQYQYDYFMSTSGTLQSSYYEYQIFFFKVTNTTPTVSVIDNENFNDIYTSDYTNKGVYILNNAENNVYDAKVTILVSAYNYLTQRYFFKDIEITNLSSFAMPYRTFEIDESGENPDYNSKIAGKNGILIEKNNAYANANFTIKIYSANTEKPSSRTFTIDTNEISGIKGRNVTLSSNTTFKIQSEFSSFNTNQPMIFSWNEKISGARTYGYVKYYPLSKLNYYNLNAVSQEDQLSLLLLYLVEFHDFLPVSYSLNLPKTENEIFKDANWIEYQNSKNFSNLINASYVKSNAGLYILEVYDQAGNSNFEIFMLDNTSPLFVEYVSSNKTIRRIMNSSEVISIPDPDTEISIEWTKNKALYINNLNEIDKIAPYAYGKDVANAQIKLTEKLSTFFNVAQNDYLKTVDNLGGFQNEEDATFSYNGTYLNIPIENAAYIKDTTSNNFKKLVASSYQIQFIDENDEAIEGTYKILLRDKSNTQITDNESYNYKNYPSSFLSFNVTSDASKMKVQYENGDNLDFASYALTGKLYKDENDNYSHIQTENAEETTLGYKFSYYSPITAKEPIKLSVIPCAENGSIVDSIVLKYYPYIKNSTENNIFYYDIDENPSKIITLFKYSVESTCQIGEELIFDLALGNETTPKPGKYVIERIYTEESAVDDYDYFLRTITFIVDDYNLISPLENIKSSNEEDEIKNSLASLIGRDIILNMYSGDNNSLIHVAFPYAYENNLTVGSFYSKDSFDNVDENLSVFAVNGNKLPMALYIPKYKYTLSNTYNENNTYSTSYNNNLSYYGNAHYELNPTNGLYDVIVEGIVVNTFARESQAKDYLSTFSISEYEIYAEIIAELNGETKYYYTNGTSVNGYLNFYEGNSKKVITSQDVTEIFSKPGKYVVTIFQADQAGATSKFYKFYKFGFEIISSQPDFNIYGENGLLSAVNDSTIYYTNSSELKIEWEVPSNKYHAKIDEDSIEIFLSNGLPATRSEITGTDIRSFTIDVSSLLNLDNSYLTITMKYEGFNSLYYTQVSKTVYFDKSAPLKNLQGLMAKTEDATNRTFSKNFQQVYMRKYYDNKNNQVDGTEIDFNKFGISYSYASDVEPYKYYSYTVDKNFFYFTLSDTIANRASYPYDTQYIYYRFVENLKTYQQVDKTSFGENNYNKVEDSIVEIHAGYYEIVERDYAGNMTVYLVYVTDSDDAEDVNVSNQALKYTNSMLQDMYESDDEKQSVVVYNEQIDHNQLNYPFNIFSNSGFSIQELTYNSDPWELFFVQVANQSQVRYLKSPWNSEGVVYRVSISSSGITLTPENISSIFESVKSSDKKHSIILSNRTEGLTKLVYLSIMDASLNTQKIEDPQRTSAILNVSIPTLNQVQSTTTSYVFPTNIKIYQFDSSSLTDKWSPIMDATQSNYGTWTPDPAYENNFGNNITFTTLSGGNTLQLKVSLGNNASQKIKYLITDNFGKVTPIIQLANETPYDEITGTSRIYSFVENSDRETTYLSDNSIKFSYNSLLYNISIYNEDGEEITDELSDIKTINNTTNIYSYNFRPTTSNVWNDYYKIVVKDSETEEELKTLHIRIYYQLPYLDSVHAEVSNGAILFVDRNKQPFFPSEFKNTDYATVNHNGKVYTTSKKTITTYSQSVSVYFRNGDNLDRQTSYNYLNSYGFTAYLSRDNGNTWENINSETTSTNGISLNGTGKYLVFFKYNSDDVFESLCKLFEVEILDSAASYYYISVDGQIISKSDMNYVDRNNVEYTTNYIVSVDYRDKNNRLKIVENKELDVEYELVSLENTGTDVYVEIYRYSCPDSVGYFTIIYIAETDNIVSSFTYETASGSSSSLKAKSYEFIVANKETESNFDKLKLIFSSYYGIKENKNHIQVLKLFNGNYIEIYPNVYENGENSYIYLTKAGTYRIKLYDSCSPANVQSFKNSKYIDIIFLNTTPITVSYTDVDGNVKTTDFVQKAVYNSSVTLALSTPSSYYLPSGYPSITVVRNGKTYNKATNTTNINGYIESNYKYTFSEPGFYSVKFSATSTTGIQVREEEYNFTIINKNESRYAYEFTNYANYYISKVYKNGIDITEDLVKIGNFDTILVNKQLKMSNLIINYLDEKTGSGRYKIVISPNDAAYVNTTGNEFAFECWINMTKPPINVSIAEGSSTTGNVKIRFNVQNLYDAVGDCYLVIGNTTRYYTKETLSNYGETENISLLSNGTFFVQLYSTSGQLLYSYKVTKAEPLNTFAIISIIVGVAVVGTIIGITIALRKRQKVK